MKYPPGIRKWWLIATGQLSHRYRELFTANTLACNISDQLLEGVGKRRG